MFLYVIYSLSFSDFLVKVVDKTDMSQKQMNGHKAPVLCVSFCPGDQLLVCNMICI